MRLLAPLISAIAVGLMTWLVLKRAPMRLVRPGDRSRLGWLAQEEIDVTPIQFWLVSLGAATLTYLVVFGVTGLGLIALMPAFVVGTFPRAYFGRKRAVRMIEVQEAWPDGIRDLISSVRSGASLPTAVENLAAHGPAPLREAFSGFSVYSRSLGFATALEMVRSDLADPTSDRVIEVLIVAYERGGAVVPEILSDLAAATTRDIWTLEEVRTEVLEQKINSRVVFVLPWLVLMAMTAQTGAFRDFYSSSAGVLIAVIGAFMSVIGIAIASRLARQPSEPRVLTTRSESM